MPLNKPLLCSLYKTTLAFCCALVLPFSSYSQHFLPHKEIGGWVGAAHYMGDLNERFTLLPFLRPGGGLLYQYNMSSRWGWRTSGSFGQVYAHDKYSSQQRYKERNLHFKSHIAELSTQLVFNFLPFEIGVETEGFLFPFTPYMFWGLGIYHFNPKAELNGTWYELKDFDTEGQGTAAYQRIEYRRLQANMPFGMGLKVGVGKKIGLGFEWGLRKTWTDYLDDVSTTYPEYAVLKFERNQTAAELSDPSLLRTKENPGINNGKQRGNPKTKDWYSFLGVVITYKIKNPKSTCPSFFGG